MFFRTSACLLRLLHRRPLLLTAPRRYLIQPATINIRGDVVYSPFHDQDIPEMTLCDYLFEYSHRWKDKTAVVCGITDKRYTFDELQDWCHRFASALNRKGFKKGDVLALFLPNSVEFIITFLGTSQTGGVVTPINATYGADELARQLAVSGARFAVTSTELEPVMQEAIKEAPAVEQVFVCSDDKTGSSFWELLQDDGSSHPGDVGLDVISDMGFMPFSSGTTVPPRPVMLSHYNIIANICQNICPELDMIRYPTDSSRETLLGILPFYHIYGMTMTMATSLRVGGKLVLLRDFEKETFLGALHKYKFSVLHISPPFLNFISRDPDVDKSMFEGIHTMVSGSARLGPKKHQRCQDKIGDVDLIIKQLYGMTETSPAITLGRPDMFKAGSVGVPVSNTQVKIVDVNSGVSLPTYHPGVVCVKGPQVMLGYYNMPERNAKMFKDGWFHTLDVGQYDEDGNVYIVDRLSELIYVRDGKHIAPIELEEILMKCPGVADCAVVGIPAFKARGNLPYAFIVRDGTTPITPGAVEQFISRHAAPHKQLRGGIRFVDSIPRSQTGKIRRKYLSSLLAKQQ